MDHRVVGIDASLTSTGYSYTDANGEVHTGRFIPKKMFGMERLEYIRDAFQGLMSHSCLYQKGYPTLIAYEGYAMGRNTGGGRSFSMGELGGVLKLFAYSRGIDVLLVPPPSLKLFMTGKGNSDKEAVMRSVASVYGYNITQDDEADAFALMKMGEVYATGRVRRGHIKRALDGCSLERGKVV